MARPHKPHFSQYQNRLVRIDDPRLSGQPKVDPMINPLVLVACKQRAGQDDADAIALPLLAWFDAAKRGRCTNTGLNHLTTHVLIAMHIAAMTKSKMFYETCKKAYDMLYKAAGRPGDLLTLTTPEYQALRKAFGWYVRALPNCEVKVLSEACAKTERIMGA